MECVSGVLIFFGQYHFVGDLAFLPSMRQKLLFECTFQCSVSNILTQMTSLVKEKPEFLITRVEEVMGLSVYGCYPNKMSIAVEDISQAVNVIMRGISVRAMCSGVSPRCLTSTKYRYLNMPYITNGIVSIIVWLSGREAEEKVYRAYEMRVAAASTAMICSRRRGV